MRRRFVWALLIVVLCVRGATAQTVWPGEDWEKATPASQGMDAEGLEKAKAWLESHNSKSGAVIRHGQIVAEWYFGDADHESKFAALGKWDNNIFVAPSLDLIIIRQSDLAPAKGHQIAEYYQLVCDAVRKP